MTTAERDAAVAEALERAAQLVPDAWLGASGTREAILALKPRSDLPQCHPTWTECPLCHNDIKRMPEGCQFKPRGDLVCVPKAQIIHLMEYWNGSRNDRAMFDALDHIMDELQAMLATAGAKE